MEARYLFTHAGGKKNTGAGLLAANGIGGTSSPDVITIRTVYPYQTLKLVPQNAELPAFSLWVAYVPEDAEQRTNHVYGLLMIEKPPIPGAIHLAWPLIRRFTERVFAEDRTAVEAEQRAWDEQGEDWNREVFPLIMDVRDVLRGNGVPLRQGSALCGGAALCANSARAAPGTTGRRITRAGASAAGGSATGLIHQPEPLRPGRSSWPRAKRPAPGLESPSRTIASRRVAPRDRSLAGGRRGAAPGNAFGSAWPGWTASRYKVRQEPPVPACDDQTDDAVPLPRHKACSRVGGQAGSSTAWAVSPWLAVVLGSDGPQRKQFGNTPASRDVQADDARHSGTGGRPIRATVAVTSPPGRSERPEV